MQIREVFDRKRFVLLDGGMGTQLQTAACSPGKSPSWPLWKCRIL